MMSSKERRNIRLEILRERYDKQNIDFELVMKNLDENKKVTERINSYLCFKESNSGVIENEKD